MLDAVGGSPGEHAAEIACCAADASNAIAKRAGGGYAECDAVMDVARATARAVEVVAKIVCDADQREWHCRRAADGAPDASHAPAGAAAAAAEAAAAIRTITDAADKAVADLDTPDARMGVRNGAAVAAVTPDRMSALGTAAAYVADAVNGAARTAKRGMPCGTSPAALAIDAACRAAEAVAQAASEAADAAARQIDAGHSCCAEAAAAAVAAAVDFEPAAGRSLADPRTCLDVLDDGTCRRRPAIASGIAMLARRRVGEAICAARAVARAIASVDSDASAAPRL